MSVDTQTPADTPNLAAARAQLKALDRRHGQFYDALTDNFAAAVQEQVTKATAALADELAKALTFDEAGRILKTPANLKALATIDTRFEALMNEYGYAKTVTAFVNQFPGQLPLLREELDFISDYGYKGGPLKKGPLVHGPLLAGPDLAALAAQQGATKTSLLELVATVGDLAKRKAMLSAGGLSQRQMTDMLSTSLGRTPGECRTLGATSLAIFYRTATERAFDKIEADAPKGTETLYFVYAGPDDKLTRPFCHALLKAGQKAYTRKEIDAMSNGQLPDVFTTCGGYNCRHQWRLALPNELPESARPKPPAPPKPPKAPKPKPPAPPKSYLPPIEKDERFQELGRAVANLRERVVNQQDWVDKQRATHTASFLEFSSIYKRSVTTLAELQAKLSKAEASLAAFREQYAKENEFRGRMAQEKKPFRVAPKITLGPEPGNARILDNIIVDLRMKFPRLVASYQGREVIQNLYVGEGFLRAHYPQYPRALGVANSIGHQMDLKASPDSVPHDTGKTFKSAWTVSETVETKRELQLAVFVHELGHLYHFRYLKEIDWQVRDLYARAMKAGRVVTVYGSTNHYEYFTESMSAMLYDAPQLKRSDPEMYAFMERFLIDKEVLTKKTAAGGRSRKKKPAGAAPDPATGA